jgi:predicted transcriptional regulator
MSTTLQPYHHYYAGPEFEHARVHDVMRVGVVTCQPETSLRDACRIMVGYQIHSLLVGDAGSGGSPWGIVTDLDIAAAATSDISELTAADLASRELVTVPANETLGGCRQVAGGSAVLTSAGRAARHWSARGRDLGLEHRVRARLGPGLDHMAPDVRPER